MSRTITAMFDSRSEADAAKARLSSSRIDADNVRIIDQGASTDSSADDAGQPGGFFQSLKNLFLPDEDAHAYGEGVSRGSFLLCAQVDEDQADEAIQILDESESVDFDKRQDEWRNDGWTGQFSGFTDTGVPSGAGMGASGQGFAAGTGGAFTGKPTEDGFETSGDAQFNVGKREPGRGGARVRSYTRATRVDGDNAVAGREDRSAFGDFSEKSDAKDKQPTDFERTDKDRF